MVPPGVVGAGTPSPSRGPRPEQVGLRERGQAGGCAGLPMPLPRGLRGLQLGGPPPSPAHTSSDPGPCRWATPGPAPLVRHLPAPAQAPAGLTGPRMLL